MINFSKRLKSLGPCLLWASAAIGVSHIVQSTRAGATYGYILLIAVLLANLFKYPFFEFATRYTTVKNETVLDGYFKLGRFAIYLFTALTLLTMFTIQAGVTRVTAAIFRNWLQLDLSFISCSVLILFFCILIILFLKRTFFNNFIKILVSILILSSITSLFLTTNINIENLGEFTAPKIISYTGITFMIALIGWMPSPIDLSAWSSIWIMEKREQGETVSYDDNKFDFNFSYIWTTFLACVFLALGANVFYGTGEEFAPNSAMFVDQLVQLYASLGLWAKQLILLTAFSTMFSTTLTCLDAFPKVLSKCFSLIFSVKERTPQRNNLPFMLFVVFGTIVTIFFLGEQMKSLVDIATILSFLTAPFLAILNYKLVFSDSFPTNYKPNNFLKLLSITGIIFLIFFTIIFISNIFGLLF